MSDQPASLPKPSRFENVSKSVVTALSILLCLFTLFEVNYNVMQPQSALAVPAWGSWGRLRGIYKGISRPDGSKV